MADPAPPARLPITAIVLACNEERHLARALQSLRFAERVVVVDSGSSDRTCEIARAHGADLFARRWLNQAEQFGWAMAETGITTPWTLRLDADEVIEADLAEALARLLPGLPDDVTGINFKRKHIFMGRWIRRGGRYPLVMLRLWRTGAARIEPRWMDEHILVDHGRVITVEGGFADINEHGTAQFIAKHNGYATREAIDVLLRRHGLVADSASNPALASRQGRIRRWIKERLYNRLPFGIGPLGYFLWRFIALGGFLDGREGRIYHVLQGLWYRYLVDVRRFEFERALRGAATAQERLERLAAASGYDPGDLAGWAARRGPSATHGLPE